MRFAVLQQKFYSRKEICRHLNIGNTKFYEEVKAGRLKIVKIGKLTRVCDDDLSAYVAACREGKFAA
jgi:excisionase family DNA binding protein